MNSKRIRKRPLPDAGDVTAKQERSELGIPDPVSRDDPTIPRPVGEYHARLRSLAKREISPEEARDLFRYLASSKEWRDAYASIIVDEQSRPGPAIPLPRARDSASSSPSH